MLKTKYTRPLSALIGAGLGGYFALQETATSMIITWIILGGIIGAVMADLGFVLKWTFGFLSRAWQGKMLFLKSWGFMLFTLATLIYTWGAFAFFIYFQVEAFGMKGIQLFLNYDVHLVSIILLLGSVSMISIFGVFIMFFDDIDENQKRNLESDYPNNLRALAWGTPLGVALYSVWNIKMILRVMYKFTMTQYYRFIRAFAGIHGTSVRAGFVGSIAGGSIGWALGNPLFGAAMGLAVCEVFYLLHEPLEAWAQSRIEALGVIVPGYGRDTVAYYDYTK